ncbi:MAG: 50S ribosomal protein L31e [Candidatus Helarchaeota archaeon]
MSEDKVQEPDVEEKNKIEKEEIISDIQEDLKLIEEEKDQLIEEEIIAPEEEKIPKILPLKKKEEEEDILEERFYTIPLGRVTIAKRYKRAKRAIKLVREFLIRHFKAEGLKIEPELNEYIWSRGIEKPPRRVKVRATKDSLGIVTAYLVK